MSFKLMQHHGYSLTELENMIPWERDIYIYLVMEYVKEENERINKQNRK
jgi:SET domain-containing protein